MPKLYCNSWTRARAAYKNVLSPWQNCVSKQQVFFSPFHCSLSNGSYCVCVLGCVWFIFNASVNPLWLVHLLGNPSANISVQHIRLFHMHQHIIKTAIATESTNKQSSKTKPTKSTMQSATAELRTNGTYNRWIFPRINHTSLMHLVYYSMTRLVSSSTVFHFISRFRSIVYVYCCAL